MHENVMSRCGIWQHISDQCLEVFQIVQVFAQLSVRLLSKFSQAIRMKALPLIGAL